MSKKALGGIVFFLLTFILVQWLVMPDRSATDTTISFDKDTSSAFENREPIMYESLVMNLSIAEVPKALLIGMYQTEEIAISKKEEYRAKADSLSLWRTVDVMSKKRYILLAGPYSTDKELTEGQKQLSAGNLNGQIVAFPVGMSR